MSAIAVGIISFVCGFGGMIFLIEEMNKPPSGLMKVSSAPLIDAVEHIGKQ